jgi:hypothetical protein
MPSCRAARRVYRAMSSLEVHCDPRLGHGMASEEGRRDNEGFGVEKGAAKEGAEGCKEQNSASARLERVD